MTRVFWDGRSFPAIPPLLDGFVGQLWRLLTPYRLGITNILNKQLATMSPRDDMAPAKAGATGLIALPKGTRRTEPANV